MYIRDMCADIRTHASTATHMCLPSIHAQMYVTIKSPTVDTRTNVSTHVFPIHTLTCVCADISTHVSTMHISTHTHVGVGVHVYKFWSCVSVV